MTEILRRDSDELIIAIGNRLASIAGATVFEITDAQAQEIFSKIGVGGITSMGNVQIQPLPAAPSLPDIPALARALIASPSIDQTTKNALVAALQPK